MKQRLTTLSLFICIFLLTNFKSFGQFQKLYDFDSIHGASPSTTQLVYDGKWFYGTAYNGGAYNKGVVFKIKPDGSNMTTLYSFGQNLLQGYYPYCHLVKKDNFLYGTALFCQTPKKGVIFRVDTNGNNYKVLHTFTGAPDGATPWASLAISGNVLFGTTTYGGLTGTGYGTVFKLNIDSTNYQVIHRFDLNSNGSYPYCTLTVKDSVLYGVTMKGGSNSKNSVYFKIDTSGDNFTKLHEFDSLGGWNPYGEIIIYDDTVYGLTSSGGDYNFGVVYKMEIDGTGYQKLHSFGLGSDGKTPFGSLILFQNTLYGSTNVGGTGGFGTLFKIRKDGSQYEKIFDFDGALNGKKPGTGSLVLIDGKLYGTTINGGNSGTKSYGIIFKTDTVYTVITGINRITGSNYKVYPNPTTGILNLENIANCEIEVFDITGRMILKKISDNKISNISIDIHGCNPGIYLLKIKEMDNITTCKIVLQ